LTISGRVIFTWRIGQLKTSGIGRWAGWLALVVVFSLATSALSWWQFSRREERVDAINLVLANYDTAPVALEELVWRVDDQGVALDQWRQVNVSGRYLPEHLTLARNRPLNGQPGFLQLVPFQLADGSAILIERGWLPTGSRQDSPDFMPTPDDLERDLVIRLRPGEPDLARAPVPGQIASIHLPTLAERFGLDMSIEYYGRLVAERPVSAEYPVAMPRPTLNEGNHLSYALQWVLFGLMAFAAFFWAVRQDREQRLIAAGLAKPKPTKFRQADRDAAAEDS